MIPNGAKGSGREAVLKGKRKRQAKRTGVSSERGELRQITRGGGGDEDLGRIGVVLAVKKKTRLSFG